MQKVQIELNKDKMARERRYSPAKVEAAIDSIFVERYGMLKGEDGFYLGHGTADDFTGFMSAIMLLKGQPWFVDNVKTWLWYNSDDSADPESFAVEDIMEHYGLAGAIA